MDICGCWECSPHRIDHSYCQLLSEIFEDIACLRSRSLYFVCLFAGHCTQYFTNAIESLLNLRIIKWLL